VTSTDAQGTATPVTVSGTIRGLDVQNQSFTLSASGVSRIVRADETTQTWIRGAQARFGSLQNGMTVAVRGTDQRRFVLAQSIVSR
jgi:exosome complex RNA-binding protein Rrp4